MLFVHIKRGKKIQKKEMLFVHIKRTKGAEKKFKIV